MNEKKAYETPVLQELGKISDVIEMNGLYGQIDGPVVVLYPGQGFSPHQSY